MSRTKAVLSGWHGPHKPSPAKARALRRETVDPPAWALSMNCMRCDRLTPFLRGQTDGSRARLCDECEGESA